MNHNPDNPVFPTCQNLSGANCSYVSTLTGNPIIDPVVCILCRYQGGPYCGSEAETPDQFLKAIIAYRKKPQIAQIRT